VSSDAIQSFFGNSPREALVAVKAALGEDAVIVDTREVTQGHSGKRYEVRVQAPQETSTSTARPKAWAPVLSPPLPQTTAKTSTSMDLDLHATVARRLFERVRRIEAHAVTSSTSAFEQAVSELVSFTRAPWARSASPRRSIAFVGPTGSGKTTTMAKVAARALVEGQRVALVTTDTWRVGAVQHLARYAEILSLPCYVAAGDELQNVLSHARGADLVLIDTAGRTPNDPSESKEIARFRSLPQIETHLVVPSSTTEKQLARLRTRYDAYGPSGVIVTKLDEADGPGGIVGCSALLGLPIAAISDGQDVPDDIHGASLRELLARMNGGAK
jgi:flagellar biosynthesis protein FlhF